MEFPKHFNVSCLWALHCELCLCFIQHYRMDFNQTLPWLTDSSLLERDSFPFWTASVMDTLGNTVGRRMWRPLNWCLVPASVNTQHIHLGSPSPQPGLAEAIVLQPCLQRSILQWKTTSVQQKEWEPHARYHMVANLASMGSPKILQVYRMKIFIVIIF